jgi:hypothetical protein
MREEPYEEKKESPSRKFLNLIKSISDWLYREIWRFARRHQLITLLILGIFVYYFLEYIYFPNSINLSGVTNLGTGVKLTQLTFYNTTNNSIGKINLTSTGYSAVVPNQNSTFKVVGKWASNYSWQGGYTNTTVSFNRTTFGLFGTINRNLNLPTPDSTILVKGNVKVTAISQKLLFVAINQTTPNQTANIQAVTGSYNLTLPNFVTYKVSLVYTNVSLSLKPISSASTVCDDQYQLKERAGISNVTQVFVC